MAFYRKSLTPKVQHLIDDLFEKKLSRPLSDIKRLNPGVIIESIQSYYPQFRKGNLWNHQLAGILLGLENRKLGLWLDPGLGKSYIALEIMRIRRLRKENVGKTLIVVPSAANLSEWRKQINQWTDQSCLILDQPGKIKKLSALEKAPETFSVITYSSLQALLKTSGYKRYRIEEDTMGALLYHFNSVISDESHKAKNRGTNIFKCLDVLSENVGYYLALTGTPINSLEDVWAQSVLIDGGRSLGETWPVFENAFFDVKINYHGGIDLRPKSFAEEEIRKRVETFSIRYSSDECQDLPELLVVEVPVSMSGPQKSQYHKIRSAKDLGDLAMTKSKFNNMRAITSGYIKNVSINPVTEERVEHIGFFKTNPKLDWLINFLKNGEEQVIVWASYIATQDMIGKALKKEKISSLVYRDSKKKLKDLEKFISGEVRVIVANPGSLGTGTNLQNARCMIFYEAELSSITRKQSEKRIHRGGQTKSCIVYDLVMKDSVDEAIAESVRDGTSLLKRVIDGELDLSQM